MPAQMDDITVIQHFIEGDLLLIANYRLSVQPAQNMVQLMGRNGQLIAWAKHLTCPASFGVRASSEYADILNQALLEHEFVPLGLDANQPFMLYEYHPIPQEHEMHCTPGRDLWKYWWKHRKQLTGPCAETEILVFAHRCWSPVMHIDFQETTLFITTEAGETALQNQDQVAWVQPLDQTDTEDETVFFAGAPSTYELTKKLQHRLATQGGSRAGTAPAKERTASRRTAAALNYVDHCSEHELIIETPQGKVVVVGDRLAYHAAG
jgi:hypothetical protein